MPVAFAAVVVAALAAVTASVAADVNTYALDETLIKQSAVHYGSGLPAALFDDLTARGTSRLYSLLIAPLFAALDADAAIRAARILNALLFASAALPAYLIAREALLSRALAATAAVAAVGLPWLTLTTVLFTENLAYPLFLWAVLVMLRALRAPSPRRDLLALVVLGLLTGARTQFAVLFGAYWLLVALVPLARAWSAAGGRPEMAPLVRQWTRGFPFAVAALGLVVLAGAALGVTGELGRLSREVLGAYSTIQDRATVTPDVAFSLAVEVAFLAFGMAVLPAVVGVAWLVAALRAPGRRPWVFAATTAVVVVVLWTSTAYAQGQPLGELTEERYYFYVVPLVWIAALLALQDRRPASRALSWSAVTLAVLFAVVPIAVAARSEATFLVPAAGVGGIVARDLLDSVSPAGTTLRDALFLVTLVAGALLAWTWRRPGPARWVLAVAAPLAVQIALTGAALAAVEGEIAEIPGRTGGDRDRLAWVDRTLTGSQGATYLDAQPRLGPGQSTLRERTLLFWNDEVDTLATVPATGLPGVDVPLAALPPVTARVGADARFVPAAPFARPVVQWQASPHVQLAGTVVARSPDRRFELVRAQGAPRAAWLAAGLAPDGWVLADQPVELTAAAPARLRLTVTGAPAAPTHTEVRLGGERRVVRLPPSPGTPPVQVTLDACAAGATGVRGALRVRVPATLSDGRAAGLRLLAVDRAPLPPGACP